MIPQENALENLKIQLKMFPHAFLALDGTWQTCINALESNISMERDIITLEKLSGMSISQLIYLFQSGYTLQPPNDKSFEKLGMFGIDWGEGE